MGCVGPVPCWAFVRRLPVAPCQGKRLPVAPCQAGSRNHASCFARPPYGSSAAGLDLGL